MTEDEVIERYNKGDRLLYCRKEGYSWLEEMQSNDDCMVQVFSFTEAMAKLEELGELK